MPEIAAATTGLGLSLAALFEDLLDPPTTFRNRTRRPARYVVVVTAERAPTTRR